MITLQIPPGVKTLKLTNSEIWFEDDILYSRPSDAEYILSTRKMMEDDVVKMKAFIGDRKVFIIAETHPRAEQPRKEDRDYISTQLEDLIKAMAIITPNAVSRMITNLFFLFKPASFPTKMFVDVSDAKKWLATCLDKSRGLPVFF